MIMKRHKRQKQSEGRSSSEMNIVCIISNSPSATNTAIVRNYDELRYTCQELSIETKEKKKPSPSKVNTHICWELFGFYYFLPASLNLNILWKQTWFTKVLTKSRKTLGSFLFASPWLAHQASWCPAYLWNTLQLESAKLAIVLDFFSKTAQSRTLKYWYPSWIITSLFILTPQSRLMVPAHKPSLLIQTEFHLSEKCSISVLVLLFTQTV